MSGVSKKLEGSYLTPSKLLTLRLQKFVSSFALKTETSLLIPTGAFMNTPSELAAFKGDKDSQNFFSSMRML